MITQIKIRDVATYDDTDHIMDTIGKLNFIFGSNGSGKTTIGRVIAQPENYKKCEITWEQNQPQPCKIYNTDFIESVFSNVSEMPGVFTLGEHETKTYNEINHIEKQIENITTEKIKLVAKLGKDDTEGKKKECKELLDEYTEEFWQQKKTYEVTALKAGLEGFLNDKRRFFNKFIEEHLYNNEELLPKEQLIEKAKILFDQKPRQIDLIPVPNFQELLTISKNDILKRKIIGKEDVDLGALIKKLNNSDWVKAGKKYLDSVEDVCPFCQRPLNNDFRAKLEEYFDESYTDALREIADVKSKYSQVSTQIKEKLNNILNANYDFVDNSSLRGKIEFLSKTIDKNINFIDHKQANASSPIELEDCTALTDAIKTLIEDGNKKIDEHNHLVTNIREEKNKLTSQIWRFITYEKKSEISTFLSQKEALKKEIQDLEQKIEESDRSIKEQKHTLENLQRQLTSVIPTRDAINRQLEEFGFTGFRLELSADNHSYIIMRNNGEPVNKSLSEGERNFITFLYFYSLINGSLDQSNFATKQTVIIDDPVSSMDSDILFIVSTLIKKLMEDMTKPNTNIAQLFVLTHNMYFHKEVTYERHIPKSMKKEMHFWIIRKQNDHSNIFSYTKNPVKSTYETLWEEIYRAKENPEAAEQSSLKNTMRRILDHYFTFYGNTNLSQLPLKLKNEDPSLVRSLLSWINAGSHGHFEDFSYVPPMSDGIQRYLNIFAKIFEETGQIAHYNMMMKIEEENENG